MDNFVPLRFLLYNKSKSWLNVLSAQQQFLISWPSNAKRQQILINNKHSFIVVLRLRATLRDSYSFLLSCHFVWNFLCPSSSFVLSYLHVRVDLKFNIFHGILSASIFRNALDHHLTFIIKALSISALLMKNRYPRLCGSTESKTRSAHTIQSRLL